MLPKDPKEKEKRNKRDYNGNKNIVAIVNETKSHHCKKTIHKHEQANKHIYQVFGCFRSWCCIMNINFHNNLSGITTLSTSTSAPQILSKKLRIVQCALSFFNCLYTRPQRRGRQGRSARCHGHCRFHAQALRKAPRRAWICVPAQPRLHRRSKSVQMR